METLSEGSKTFATHLTQTYDNAFVVYSLQNKAFALIQFDERPNFPKSVTRVIPTESVIQLRDANGRNYFYSTEPERSSEQMVLGTATFKGKAANEIFLISTNGALALNANADLSLAPCSCRPDKDAFPCESGGKGADKAGTTHTDEGATSFCDVRCGEELSACANY